MCKKESLLGVLARRRHDRPGKVFPPRSVHGVCRGLDERIKAMLRRFMPRERRDMTGGDGMIGVGCEFCSTYRAFDPEDSGA
ncbi:MAG TPA: Hsp33 family molecular chaperone HslO [Methylocella sp.]|nr:Hsp33 family molecular chaperone HslO [Methylocella sp.]